jgi:hypothetical protein
MSTSKQAKRKEKNECGPCVAWAAGITWHSNT